MYSQQIRHRGVALSIRNTKVLIYLRTLVRCDRGVWITSFDVAHTSGTVLLPKNNRGSLAGDSYSREHFQGVCFTF